MVWPGVQSPQLTLTTWSITSGLVSESGSSMHFAQSEFGPVDVAETSEIVIAFPPACDAVNWAFTLPVHGMGPV